jgi:hypothetical protein
MTGCLPCLRTSSNFPLLQWPSAVRQPHKTANDLTGSGPKISSVVGPRGSPREDGCSLVEREPEGGDSEPTY